ncbi:Vacuolar protein sorting-associated protein 16 [Perkinsus chesapeaki]|uniref:Vacuolar protein sorting-associated protein 16 n=1 Tax=Perkinsus chesapeaki TaxID=330153 RepID=A0A7J6LS91_PERCH|nr:Vacuolar protein sorting-associated protein 16 [Perkinsus chesapeaki]
MDNRGYSGSAGSNRLEEGRSRQEDRQRLMDSTEMLRDSSQQLHEAKRTALETEDVAVGVMSDLRSQREVISRAGNNLNEVDSNLTTARRTINTMARRAMANRMVLTIIAIAIGLAIFFDFFIMSIDQPDDAAAGNDAMMDYWYSIGIGGGQHAPSKSIWYRARELYATGEGGGLGEPGIAVSSMWTGARNKDTFTDKNIVASDSFGGLVAIVRNDKVLQEVKGSSKAAIRIYTAAGSLLACVPLPTKDVLALQWAAARYTPSGSSSTTAPTVLAVIASDLTVALLSITPSSTSDTSSCADVIHRYTLPQDQLLRQEGGVEIIKTWQDGWAVVTRAGRVHACSGWHTASGMVDLGGDGPLPEGTNPVCLLPLEASNPGSNDIRCLISVEEESKNVGKIGGIGENSGRLLLLDKNGRQEEILTGALTLPNTEDDEERRRPKGVVIAMAKSFSAHMIALLSDCGRFRILPTSPDLSPEYHHQPLPSMTGSSEPQQQPTHTGSVVITPGDFAAAQKRAPKVTAPQNSDPFCPPVPSSIADAASPMSTFTRVSLVWCGDDAVAVCVSDLKNERYTVYLGGQAPAFTLDPLDYWLDPPFDFPTGVHLQTEADGLRILDLNQTLFIQRVAPSTEAVFGFISGSRSPPATLAYAYERYTKSGDIRAELSVRALRGDKRSAAQLQRAVIGCIEAAVAETPPMTAAARERISRLMKAAQFGKQFLQSTPTAGGMAAISQCMVTAAAYIRVSATLAQAPLYMPASVMELKLLQAANCRGVVARVAERPGQQLLAFRIADWLGCDPSPAVECWVEALLAGPSTTRMTDKEILTAIMGKLRCLPQQCLATSLSAKDSYSVTTLAIIARLCAHYNRPAVASHLLLDSTYPQSEEQSRPQQQSSALPAASDETVGLLLSLGSVALALRKATELGSPDSVHQCIHTILAGTSGHKEDAAQELVKACKEANLKSQENALVATLVVERWREEQDSTGQVLRDDDAIKSVLRALEGPATSAQHSAAVALRTAITAPISPEENEEVKGRAGWWGRFGGSGSSIRTLTRSDATEMFRSAGEEFSAAYGLTRDTAAQQSAIILEAESELCKIQSQLEQQSIMRGWSTGGNKLVGLSLWETVARLVTIGEVEEARKLLTRFKLLPEYDRRWWRVAIECLVKARRFPELVRLADGSARSGGPPMGFEPIVALLIENQQLDLAKGIVGKCKKDMRQVASFYEALGMRDEAVKAQQLAEQQQRRTVGGTSLLTGWSSTIAGAMRGGVTRYQ